MQVDNLNTQKFLTQLMANLEQQPLSGSLVQQTSQELGHDKQYHQLLFPQGLDQIATELAAHIDQQMVQQLAQRKAQSSVRRQIAECVEYRIIQALPHSAMLNLNAYLMLPNNLLIASKIHYSTCSVIWYLAGDQATDFNHYSKRLLLTASYKATLCFYLQDQSHEYEESKVFIQNTLDNIVKIGSVSSKLLNQNLLKELPIFRFFFS